jgi:hypothetical protein
MTMWLQHLLVLLAVAACFGVVARQGMRTFAGKKSKFGACCSKGCDAGAPKPAGERIVFLPSDMLTVSKRSTKH